MSSTGRPAVPGRRWLMAAAVTALLAASGCGADAPSATPGEEVQGGAVGPDSPVSRDVTVLQVQLEYPLDGVYEVGEDARLFLGIANTGTTADTLTDVSGPDFTDATITGDDDDDDMALTVEPNDNVYVGAEGMPAILLEDLQTELRSSQSIPVTFTFADAGEVTVDAVVAAEGQDPVPTYDFPDPADDPSPEDG